MSAMIVRAAELASQLHQGQSQADGASHLDGHLMVVADVLFDAGASREMIAAGYLHGAVDQGSVSLDEIEREFGPEVAAMVDGLTGQWHGHVPALTHAQTAALELKRLAAEGPQVQTVKLADDLARLRKIHLFEDRLRDMLLYDVATRVEQLTLAESQVRYQVHAELSLWTDSDTTLLRSLAIMDMPMDARMH